MKISPLEKSYKNIYIDKGNIKGKKKDYNIYKPKLNIYSAKGEKNPHNVDIISLI